MSTEKVPAAIIGPGNIGTDLLAKLQRSERDRGRRTSSASSSPTGSQRARDAGHRGVGRGRGLAARQHPLPRIVFDATSAEAHRAAAPRLAEAGIVAVDLTPARRRADWSARR